MLEEEEGGTIATGRQGAGGGSRVRWDSSNQSTQEQRRFTSYSTCDADSGWFQGKSVIIRFLFYRIFCMHGREQIIGARPKQAP